MDHDSRDLIVSTPPIAGGNAVEYLQRLDIPISILNKSRKKIVVDSIKLDFQAEWNRPSCDAFVEWPCPGFEVGPDKEDYRKVRVEPTPLFLAATNCFTVMLTYRKADKIGKRLVAVQKNVAHIIIHEPRPTRGQAFISYKEPHDADLKNIMRTVARRVGFSPYVAPDDAHPGTSIWEQKIPPAIKASKICFVLWTGKTEFGEGVRREIALAKESGVSIIPLVEASAPIPNELESLDVEWTPFVRDSAPATFSRTAIACR